MTELTDNWPTLQEDEQGKKAAADQNVTAGK